jgi:predicted ferric reductase
LVSEFSVHFIYGDQPSPFSFVFVGGKRSTVPKPVLKPEKLLYTHEFYSMSRSGDEMPNAVFLTGIKIRIIWTGYVAFWFGNFVFTSALLAVVFIVVQSKAVMARALVRSDNVMTFVLAASIVNGAFVHIYGIVHRNRLFKSREVKTRDRIHPQ